MHVRFMFNAFSHDELLLIDDCIFFILYDDVLFYALLDYACRDVNVNVVTCHMSCIDLYMFLCDLYIKCH